jgi:hypothetical protein
MISQDARIVERSPEENLAAQKSFSKFSGMRAVDGAAWRIALLLWPNIGQCF